MAKKKATAAAMSKAEIVENLAERTELSKKDITSVLDSLKDLISEQLGKGGPGEITLPGLLKIYRSWKAATKSRTTMNHLTGKEITIAAKPAHYVVKLKALKGTKDMVDGMKTKLD